uniref:Uncharacterized protein n=1 Tax=Rhizophora mucronata TaxID=61149 RepID=A0A2P2QQQ3_RHIMU
MQKKPLSSPTKIWLNGIIKVIQSEGKSNTQCCHRKFI